MYFFIPYKKLVLNICLEKRILKIDNLLFKKIFFGNAYANKQCFLVQNLLNIKKKISTEKSFKTCPNKFGGDQNNLNWSKQFWTHIRIRH